MTRERDMEDLDRRVFAAQILQLERESQTPKPISPTLRYALHAMLGGALGFCWSIIFLLIYYGQQFSIPVSDAVRLKSAFWVATIILVVIALIFYRKPIIDRLRESVERSEDIEDE